MNPIELITALPKNWRWKKHSEEEISMTGEELVDMSDFVWRVGAVAIAGFIHTSYTSPPWMWFVLAEKVRFSDLVDFRRLAAQIPRGTLTAVAMDYSVGLKFAKFYGFVETGEEVDYLGRPFMVMRKI
jgi:hypothetical protein